MTNQKSSGRCWLFAALNVIRLPLVKHLNLEDFEFSQNYLFFWDKIERCNFVLHNIVETAKRNEPVDGRLVSFILRVSIVTLIVLAVVWWKSIFNTWNLVYKDWFRQKLRETSFTLEQISKIQSLICNLLITWKNSKLYPISEVSEYTNWSERQVSRK